MSMKTYKVVNLADDREYTVTGDFECGAKAALAYVVARENARKHGREELLTDPSYGYTPDTLAILMEPVMTEGKISVAIGDWAALKDDAVTVIMEEL